MVIVQAILAFVTRSAGKLLNMAFGWATAMLFGRVPQDRQIYLSVVAFGSVLWLVALLAVAFPSFGTFLLAFVPLPAWVDRKWVRLAMLAAAVVIPAIVGVVSLRMVDESERPRGASGIAGAVVRGYPYTVGLAITLVMMTIFAPVIKVRNVAKRWETAHVPVIVEPEDYLDVVAAVQRALDEGGVPTERRRATWMLRLPTKVLTTFSRRAVASVAADHLTTLRSDTIEVLLHPSDLVISGRTIDAAHARAVLAERLTVTKAYLTWDKDANDVEDRVREASRHIAAGDRDTARAILSEVGERLHRMEIPYEEWEVLFREFLLADREVARAVPVAPVMRADRVIAALIAAAPIVSEAVSKVRGTAEALEGAAREKIEREAPGMTPAARRAGVVVAHVVDATTRGWQSPRARSRRRWWEVWRRAA